jgi:hypothetical protein
MAIHESAASFAWFPLTELTDRIREALAKSATNCLFGLWEDLERKAAPITSGFRQFARNSPKSVKTLSRICESTSNVTARTLDKPMVDYLPSVIDRG